MYQKRKAFKRFSAEFDEERRQLELEKLREEISAVRKRNRNNWFDNFERFIKIIASIGLIVFAGLGYYYSEPFFAIEKKKYQMQVDSLRQQRDSLKISGELLQLDANRLRNDTVLLNKKTRAQQYILAVLRDSVDMITEFSKQDIDVLSKFYDGLIESMELQYRTDISDEGFYSPMHRSSLLYSDVMPQATPYAYLFQRRYNSNITWFELIDEPNVYAPYNGIVTMSDDESMPFIEVKCKEYYIRFYGLEKPLIAKDREFVVHQALGVGSPDYRMGLMRTVGIEVLDKNRKNVSYPYGGILPLNDQNDFPEITYERSKE